MRRIISALVISVSIGLSPAHAAPPLELASGAPDRHIVVPGDTLWGIAAKFLKDPYRWSELWKLNADDIKVPQRIYPGQVLLLDKSGKEPRLKLVTVREQQREYVEPIRQPIATIPPQDIEPFLSEPKVLDKAALEAAPRVIAIQDNRVIAGTDDMIYTTPVKGNEKAWQVFRPGRELIDPDSKNKDVIGYEAQFLGTARLVGAKDPASFKVLNSKQEISRDDRLIPAPRQDVVSYIPHAPTTDIRAKVLSIYSGINFSGPQSVVALNKGKAAGLEPGHVLAADIAGATVDDRYDGKKATYTLPDLRNGLLFVFKVFDRVSYALVMSATRPVSVGDTVRTP
jgi:hypothetical protein